MALSRQGRTQGSTNEPCPTGHDDIHTTILLPVLITLHSFPTTDHPLIGTQHCIGSTPHKYEHFRFSPFDLVR